MTAHLRYLRYVLRHKWFVFVAGLQTGAPIWRLIVHDWSKFLPWEWFAYVAMFYGKTPSVGMLRFLYGGRPNDAQNRADWREETRAAFDRAWLHHQHVNAHHWQHWVLRNDDGTTTTLEMPDGLVREMAADWMGAGRAITGEWEVAEWYAKNRAKMVLHPNTRMAIEDYIQLSPGRAPSTYAR